MKKIIFYLCFFTLFGCGGYEPLFSTKNLSFYIENIENVNDDSITKGISKNLNSNKIKANDKKSYILKISSEKKENITSKNSKGEVVTYEMLIDYINEATQYHNQIKTTLVKIDFLNGDIFHYLDYLAAGMVEALGY